VKRSLKRASEGDASEWAPTEACVKRSLKRTSEGDASEWAGIGFFWGRSALPKFESRFRGCFQDAPVWIELRGFEAGGGGKLPVTLLNQPITQDRAQISDLLME
jgi:hypothetical protein